MLALDRQEEIIMCFYYVNKSPKSQFICSTKRISMTTTTLVSIYIRRRKQLYETRWLNNTEREKTAMILLISSRNFFKIAAYVLLVQRMVHALSKFSEETTMFSLNNCLELSSEELDLVILASIQAFTRSKSTGENRRSPLCSFYFQSKPICKEMFLHFYGVSYS